MSEDLLELPVEAFDAPPRDQEAIDAEVLSINVDGYEGPLDLLLTLARTQKVDLREVSILQLAEQYLEFVSAAQKLRIELAADYLVMAAWLAYLKSRLLLPPPHPEDEPTGEDLAARLAFQLERLEAMRKASAELMARDQLGRDFFARGMTETVTVKRDTTWTATLSDLLKAYARVKTREEYSPLQVDRRSLWTMDQALDRLKSVIGEALEWTDISGYLPEGFRLDPAKRRSALASTFAASLELAKRGEVEISQDSVFAPIYLRKRAVS
ncbi:MAG: ScpA family protein [Pseudomonadota bacterium]